MLAVTLLMNRIKSELSYAAVLELCNVSNLYKRKGDKSSFNSYRGIFRAPVLSNILDKLLHKDERMSTRQSNKISQMEMLGQENKEM